jgi:hypothetical protein
MNETSQKFLNSILGSARSLPSRPGQDHDERNLHVTTNSGLEYHVTARQVTKPGEVASFRDDWEVVSFEVS